MLAYAAVAQYSCAESGLFAHNAQKQMLGADIAVTQAERGKPRLLDGPLGLFREFFIVLQGLFPLVHILIYLNTSAAPILSYTGLLTVCKIYSY